MHGADHLSVSQDLNVLGVLLIKQNQLETALPILKRSLAIREKFFGDGHPNVATALNNLATLLEKQNKLEEAEVLFARALKIRETTLGHEHKHTMHSQNNLTDLVEHKEIEDSFKLNVGKQKGLWKKKVDGTTVEKAMNFKPIKKPLLER
jgi:tetratricopeptide (TPR) repeat protein